MSDPSAEPTHRFSERASAYASCRPGYPEAAFQFMTAELGLTSHAVVADIGAGTGILSEHFLRRENPVWGVEPNRAMREHAKALLSAYPKCSLSDGSAEETGLQSKSFDFIVAGQAFHWFKIPETRAEFSRILKPGGWIVLLWNQREPHEPGFISAYEGVLEKFNIDYRVIKTQSNDERAILFFKSAYQRRLFANPVSWDFDHLTGYMFSASYMPRQGTPQSEEMLAGLRRIFALYQKDGKIHFSFTTELICGRL